MSYGCKREVTQFHPAGGQHRSSQSAQISHTIPNNVQFMLREDIEIDRL